MKNAFFYLLLYDVHDAMLAQLKIPTPFMILRILLNSENSKNSSFPGYKMRNTNQNKNSSVN